MDSYRWYAVDRCRQWLQAVVVQGNRLIETADLLIGLGARTPSDVSANGDTAEWSLEHLFRTRDLCRMEEDFFVTAVHKARQWFTEAVRSAPGLAAQSAAFCGATHYAKDIRNMREHDIEYLSGRGDCQDRFVYRDSLGSVQADATASIVSQSGYLVGNRLSVQRTIELAEGSLPLVRKTLGIMSRLYQPAQGSVNAKSDRT